MTGTTLEGQIIQMHAPKSTIGGSFEDLEASEDCNRTGTKRGTTVIPDRKSNRELSADAETAGKQAKATDTECFSDFFEETPKRNNEGSGVEPDQNQTGSRLNRVLSLKEAVEFYKISEKTIRLHIKDGKIPARKEEGARGLEWRIYPHGLPQCHAFETIPAPDMQDASEVAEICITEDEASNRAVPERNQTGTAPEPDWHDDANFSSNPSEVKAFAPELRTLLDVITKQAEKLEAASMRIGYLEAKSEHYENQIKLLTDSEYKRGWWQRFGSWLIGRPN